MATKKSPETLPAPASEARAWRELVKQAEAGDKAALSEVRRRLDDAPALIRLWQSVAEHAEAVLLETNFGKTPVTKEVRRREAAALREELAGPNPSPLERILVDRVVICWLQVALADVHSETVRGMVNNDATNHNLQRSEALFTRRQDAAHRRLLSAIRTLATVRRLALPVLQVNIGQNQINTTAAVGSLATPAPKALPSGDVAEAPGGA